MLIPNDLFYTKDHEWIRIKDSEGTMGITDFAQNSLGDITFIDLPKPGVSVKQFEWCATVESVKAASDVFAPLSGEIMKANTELSNHPELVNKAPYEAGWFAIIKIADKTEESKLMTASQYKEYLQGLSK